MTAIDQTGKYDNLVGRILIGATVSRQLRWSHDIELLKTDDVLECGFQKGFL